MSYSSAIDQLNAMTPELFTQPGNARRKFSLEEIGTLLNALDNPHWRFPSVLIAGTNGKGSTASTLASILAASGLRTGLYTSPHLTRPNERIRISGVEISDEAFADTYFRVHHCAQELVATGKLAQLPSFFEHLTAMAFLYFAEGVAADTRGGDRSSSEGQSVAIAVLEVGMGGRLDATNIVDPLLSVITDISLDHTEWLGPTIAAITREKAGILRRNGTLITLPQHPEANQVIGEIATELGVRAVSAVPYMPQTQSTPEDTWHDSYYVQALGAAVEVASPLHGEHQHRNIALAIAAASELAFHHGVPITPASIANGIRNTSWPGRLERMETKSQTSAPTQWVLDVAHNPAGAWALRAGLRRLVPEDSLVTRGPHREASVDGMAPRDPHDQVPVNREKILIFSCLRDKPIAEMAQILFPIFDRVIFAPIHSIRATPMEDLLAAATTTGTPATVAASVEEALALAEQPAAVEELQEAGTSTNPTSVILSDRSEAKGAEGPAVAFQKAPISTKMGAPEPGSPSTGPGRSGGGPGSWDLGKQEPTSAESQQATTTTASSGKHEVKGHDFSRAVPTTNNEGASAPEREAPPAPRVVVVSGSVYLVGEARPLILSRTAAEAPK